MKQKTAHILLFLFFVLPFSLTAQTEKAKHTLVVGSQSLKPVLKATDSLALIRAQHYRDSLKHISDSLALVWIKTPPANRPNRFVDSLARLYQVHDLDFQAWADKFVKKHDQEAFGRPRRLGESWIISIVFLLIVFFAVFKNIFRKEIDLVIGTFYNQKLLNQLPGGGQLFSTWPFIFLYLLFGFTIGMFLFLLGKFFTGNNSAMDGMRWYLVLSASIIVLLALKVLVLRLLGYVLQIQRVIKTYVSMLYLFYFLAAIMLLPLIFSISLSPVSQSGALLYAAIGITALVLLYQLVKMSINMLLQSPFPKFYLFIYLCALEICPILILIRVLRF